jgi:hypothetical protein
LDHQGNNLERGDLEVNNVEIVVAADPEVRDLIQDQEVSHHVLKRIGKQISTKRQIAITSVSVNMVVILEAMRKKVQFELPITL